MRREYGILYADGTVIDLGTGARLKADQDLKEVRHLYGAYPTVYHEFEGATLVATEDDRLTWFEVTD